MILTLRRGLAAALVLAVLASCGQGSTGPGQAGDSSAQQGGDSGTTADGGSVSGAADEPSSADPGPQAGSTATSGTPGESGTTPSAGTTAQDDAAAKALAESKRLRDLKVASPVLTPTTLFAPDAITVELACATAEAVIHYTLDGTEPNPAKGTVYKGPFKVGESVVVKAVAFVPGGNQSPVQGLELTVGALHVRPGASGDGSRSKPLGSINAAIGRARELGMGELRLASGTWQESVDLAAPLTMSGSWDQNFAKKTASASIIRGQATASSTKKSPAYALKAGAGAQDARLENLDFQGGESEYSTGIFVTDGATPQFRNVRSSGGSSTYGYGALVNGQAAPVFAFAELSGGEGASGYGISIDSGRASLESCIAHGGAATVTSAGAMVTDGRILVTNSVLSANDANTCYGLALYNSKGTKVEASTLHGGSGRQATALFISTGDPEISGSILAADGKKASYGIHDNYGDSHPSSLSNIAFSGCTTALYNDIDTKTLFTGLNEKGQFTAANGKIFTEVTTSASVVEAALPLGTGPAMKSSSNLPAAVARGGLAASRGSRDAGGNARTEPWSIGAWEIDP